MEKLVRVSRYLIMLLLLLSIGACQESKQKWMISNFSDKHWDIYRMGGKNYKRPLYGYKFERTGKCIYYFYIKNKAGKTERQKFDFGDVYYPETWSLKNDSILTVLGIPYKLLSLTNDSMLLVNRSNRTDSLYLATESTYFRKEIKDTSKN